jgi:hypothetical protein
MLSIEKLYDSKLILRRNNSWCIKNKNTVCVKKIEAVEAKINKLEDAFQQALINKSFASESYVLSKFATEPQKEKMDIFGKFGIGLYSRIKDGFKVLNDSSKALIPVSFNSIYFSEWVGRILFSKRRDI